jgi:hypothetical protein
MFAIEKNVTIVELETNSYHREKTKEHDVRRDKR